MKSAFVQNADEFTKLILSELLELMEKKTKNRNISSYLFSKHD